MDQERLTARATAYRFLDLPMPTFVYVIATARRVWVIDTFCGSLCMESIVKDLPKGREVMVVNTHFHWDHVWGNCAFPGEVISHRRCRELMAANWERDLARYGTYRRGRVDLRLPTITFETRLTFPEEGIELFYSPGHTGDSISLFDHEDRLLYVGDNLERPLVYVEDPDLDTYLRTLEEYKKYRPKLLLAGHAQNITLGEMEGTIAYLRQLKAGTEVTFATEEERRIHEANQKVVKTTRVHSPSHTG